MAARWSFHNSVPTLRTRTLRLPALWSVLYSVGKIIMRIATCFSYPPILTGREGVPFIGNGTLRAAYDPHFLW